MVRSFLGPSGAWGGNLGPGAAVILKQKGDSIRREGVRFLQFFLVFLLSGSQYTIFPFLSWFFSAFLRIFLMVLGCFSIPIPSSGPGNWARYACGAKMP